jgi:phenylacetate-coenzyme A ligase PaaK-like adenylate-forming protein
MEGAAQVLVHCWRGLGIGPGDRVAIYDYGTSPLTLFASSSYLPYLRAGAADLIGCTPICNDGLPELAARAIHLLKYVRPEVMFANAEAMEALLAQAAGARSHLDGLACTIVVSADEQAIRPEQMARWRQGLGLPVRQLLRADPGLFLAVPCAVCDAHHASKDHYLLEVLSEDGHEALPAGEVGLLTVTNLFVKTCPIIRYVTEVRAALVPARGSCGAGNFTIRIAE